MKITEIDSVMCHTDCPSLIKNVISVTREYWAKDEDSNRKVRHEYEVSLVSKDGAFLSGFLPRILNHCKKHQIEYQLERMIDINQTYAPQTAKDINPPGITLYDDQKRAIEKLHHHKRGIFQAPTGTGKTILCRAIINFFQDAKFLIIVPSISILHQTATEFREKFKMKTSIVGDGKKDLSGDVVISIINSLHRIPEEEYQHLFTGVIVDEVHHVASFDGMFYDVMTALSAPIKIGVTATAKVTSNLKDKEAALACEGLLGPLIDVFPIHEAVETGRLAKPHLILIPVPQNTNIRDLNRYNDYKDENNQPKKGVYSLGVVYNRFRNNLIASFVAKYGMAKGQTAIVFTKQLIHAEMLYDAMLDKQIRCEIVNSTVTGKLREKLRQEISEKRIDCIIATAAWKEGVNIPSLNIIINAAGYRSSTPVIQMAGRGLRASEGKDKAIIVDFLDIGRFLSEHCVERLQTYMSLGWMDSVERKSLDG